MSLILDTLRRHAAAMPARAAVIAAADSISFAELADRFAEASDVLAGTGARVVGLAADNGIDWIVADLAALQAGVTLVPIPPFFTPQQVEHLLTAARVDTLITDRSMAGIVDGYESVGASIGTLTVLRQPAADDTLLCGRMPDAKITFTSGSTGLPRGVRLAAGVIETC